MKTIKLSREELSYLEDSLTETITRHEELVGGVSEFGIKLSLVRKAVQGRKKLRRRLRDLKK